MDPLEGKLHELDVVLFEMPKEGEIDAFAKVTQFLDLDTNAWLTRDIVVLNAIEQFVETPKGVGLDGF